MSVQAFTGLILKKFGIVICMVLLYGCSLRWSSVPVSKINPLEDSLTRSGPMEPMPLFIIWQNSLDLQNRAYQDSLGPSIVNEIKNFSKTELLYTSAVIDSSCLVNEKDYLHAYMQVDGKNYDIGDQTISDGVLVSKVYEDFYHIASECVNPNALYSLTFSSLALTTKDRDSFSKIWSLSQQTFSIEGRYTIWNHKTNRYFARGHLKVSNASSMMELSQLVVEQLTISFPRLFTP